MHRFFLSLLLGLVTLAAADPSEIVASVDGHPITIRELEHETLRKEGAEALEAIAQAALDALDWSALGDGPVLTLPNVTLERTILLAELLPTHREAMLEELLNVAVVTAELERRGVAIDDALIQREVARADRALQAVLARKGMAPMDFASYLRQNEGLTVAQFTARAGFRVLVAGLHALVRAEAADSVDDATLQALYESRRATFGQPEARNCAAIYIPFQTEVGPDGVEAITDDERARLTSVVSGLHRQIAGGQTPFGGVFRAFARSYDADADRDGGIGWVLRDGRRERAGARVLAPEAVAQVYATEGPFPILLAPIVSAKGIDLIEVRAVRQASERPFAEVREDLLAGLVEGELDQRSRATLTRLRSAATAVRRDDGTITVAGRHIAPRQIEDAILERHGAEAAAARMKHHIAELSWANLDPAGRLLFGSGVSLPTHLFRERLLEMYGASVREALIGIELLRAAVANAGIVVTPALVEAELQRMERAYSRAPEARRRSFVDFMRANYGSGLAELRQDPAFHALSGCAELVRRRYQPDDATCAAWYAQHIAAYRRPEAVELSGVSLPHRARDGEVVLEADKERTRRAALQLHALLGQPGASMAEAWRQLGRAAEPASIDGKLGWVTRDGRRERPDAPEMPAEVMTAAFAARPPWPCLLPPIEHLGGLIVFQVTNRRDASDPPLAEVREQVIRDSLEADWDVQMTTMVDDLRRNAVITYGDLAGIMRAQGAAAAGSATP